MQKTLNALMSGEPAQPEQVSQVVEKLMKGELDPAFGAAFLCLQMRNGIDGDQLKAALDVMMQFAATIKIDADDAVDNCGTGGDGSTLR